MNPSSKPTILITGGTGLIGSALQTMLEAQGYPILILSRNPSNSNHSQNSRHSRNSGQLPKSSSVPQFFAWDPSAGTIDPEAIKRADIIIHLAGAGVADKRWNAKRKKEIVESRTLSGALLVKALKETPNQVKAVISMSGIGWYGADPVIPNPHPFKEPDPADDEFLGETCRAWEAAIQPVTDLGKRLVIFRTGVVLSRSGGALKEFIKPVKMGIAAILGSGKQVLSWIHIKDMSRLLQFAIETQAMEGIYNAVAPYPVDNKTLTQKIASRLKGKYFVQVYVPSFVLKIMVGELSIEVLKSATVSSEKCRKAGFQFTYPSIDSALDNLISH